MAVQLWVILATAPRMFEAEQYFSLDSLIARSTLTGARLRSLTRSSMHMAVKTLGSVSVRWAVTSTSRYFQASRGRPGWPRG